MATEIMRKLKQILKFIDDDYSIIQHIKEDPHEQYGLLKSIPRKELKEFISLAQKN